MKKIILIIIILFLLGSINSFVVAKASYKETNIADGDEKYFIEYSPLFENQKKPIVAVALGGGGARGFVNIGVLKALTEENIPIDMVVGTSMGAVIAAMYGSGLPLTEMEKIISPELMVSKVDLNFPFTRSLLTSRKLDYIIQKAAPIDRLEHFPIPTALLSLDLSSGASVIRTTGKISDVVKSSYAIPLIFPVTEDEGAYMIDPGVLELIPARAARLLGADVVISVTAYDELPYTTYDLPFRAWIRMINVVKEKNSRKIVAENSDYILEFEVGKYSYLDFGLIDRFIEMGYVQTKDNIAEIKELLRKRQIAPAVYDYSSYYQNNSGRLDKLIRDIKQDRIIYDFIEFKPLISYGADNFQFSSGYYTDRLPGFQYGLKVDQKNLEVTARVEGEEKFELAAEYIKMTPELDLQMLYNKDKEREILDFLLIHFKENFITGGGIALIDTNSYLHLFNNYTIAGRSIELNGNIEVLSALNDNIPVNEAVWEHEFVYSLNTDLELLLQSVVGWGECLKIPQRYRGQKGYEPGRIQAAVEMKKHHNFIYSHNFLEFFQLSAVDFYQFLDYTDFEGGKTAAGAGVEMDINIFGVKPITCGGYLSYDLNEKSYQGSLMVDFSF